MQVEGYDYDAEVFRRLRVDTGGRIVALIYGSQTQPLQQRASTYDLLVQLRSGGVEIDPRDVSDRADRVLGLAKVGYDGSAYQYLRTDADGYLLIKSI